MVKSLLKPITTQRWLFFKILFLSSKSSFLVGLIVLVIRAGICSWYDEILTERSFYPKDDQFAKWWETPPNHRFQLPIWCLSSKRQFGALTVKPCSRSPFSGAYHQNDILYLYLWNPLLTPLKPKKWPICKILSSHAFESLFSASLMVLIIHRHFQGLTLKFSLNPITTQKLAHLEDTERHLEIIVFS